MLDLTDSGWWQVLAAGSAGVVTLFSGATFWVSWGLRRSFVPRDEFLATEQKNEDRDIQIETRLTRLETRLEYFPTSEMLDAIRTQIARLQAEMEGQRESSNRIENKLETLNEFLLQREQT